MSGTAVAERRPAAAIVEHVAAGAGALARFIARRDYKLLAVWVITAVGIPLGNTFSLAGLLPTPEARQDFVDENTANAIVMAMLGPFHSTSIEGIVAWRSAGQGVLISGLAGILLVIRHTRTEEENGRQELLGATAVGRHAGLTAILSIVFATNLIVAAAQAATFIARGYPVAGSVAFGLAIAATGWVFAAAAGVVVQLAGSTALARVFGVGLLGVALAPSVISGADRTSWLPWVSPIGWVRLTRAYADERWWVPALPVAVAAGVLAVAYTLAARRDLGSGLLHDRAGTTGPARAPRWLHSPLALAYRLHTDRMGGWLAYIAILSVMIGWAVSNFDELFTGNDTVAGWLDGSRSETVADAFLGLLSYILCLMVACVAIGIAVRARTEEAHGFLSPLLVASVSRTRWLAGHLVIAFGAPVVLLLEVGLFTSLSYGIATGRMGVLADQLVLVLLFVPAVWLVVAVPFTLLGLRPRLVLGVSWLVMALSVVVVSLWETDQISEALFVLTPFGNNHPTVTPRPAMAVGSVIVAALLVAVGVAAFRRRDISEEI